MKQTSLDIIGGIANAKLEDLSFMMNHSMNENLKFGEDIRALEARNPNISDSILQLGEVKKLLVQLKNSKMIDKKDFILNTINTALSDVFNDQNVKIDLIASNSSGSASKLNIKYDIVLYQNGLEMARNEKLLLKNGGGVLSFISILFKILVGFIYSKNKFYIFDESLAEVSEMYRPRMAQFIQKFCETHDFTIIIITQTSDIAEYADLVYQLDGDFEEGIPNLKIDKIEGEYPEENYIYSKIENFQSIKKLEFRYKGFTAIIGKNNIGKSASFRAVNSIIFNNFDMKEYPRMFSAEKPTKLLASKIEFGKFTVKDDPENENTKIKMYKKGSSLIYEFNNDTFVGKNLAFEKVKEKIESIGFKYLNLKEQYKNFKGNLKDQTERLAITTQQDSYYLIGSKANDTSKVFDFLFDSREVTLAIMNLNNDVLELEQELNTNLSEIHRLTNIVNFNILKIQLIQNKYKTKLIEEMYNASADIHTMEKHQFILSSIIRNIDKILSVSAIIYSLGQSTKEVNHITNRQNILNKYLDIINKMIVNFQYQICIKDISANTKAICFFTKQQEVLHKKIGINFIQFYMSLDNIIKTIYKKQLSSHRKVNIFTKLIEIVQSKSFIENYMIQSDNKNKSINRIEYLTRKSNVITTLIDKIHAGYSIGSTKENLISHRKYLDDLKKAELIRTKEISLFTKLISINGIQKYFNDRNENIHYQNNINIEIKKKRVELNELPSKFGLTACNTCGGYGFHKH